ncbi:hypothetical protein [uncultured Marinobacter sp.]|uniref:hypothetical protein n=1 Tax=uncultured Marinobacter sp. TaxID=187379 RepID=UPI0026173A25|nr:hypothetical protein [uncultured Marinobacter sp.]
MKVKIDRNQIAITLAFCSLILLRVATAPTATLSFLILAAYATLGRAQAIKALSLCWLFTMVNPGLAPGASFSSIGRYMVFLGAFIAVFARTGIRSGSLTSSGIVLSTVGLGVFIMIHSMFASPMPDVSILKAVSWLVVTATLFSAWSGLSSGDREKLFRHLYLGLVAIMAVSLPLFVLPLGYLRNGSGFQGILNHPQAFGPTMAILGAIAASKLFSEKRPSWQYLGIFGVSLLFIMASEARTAGLALVIGLCMAIASVPVLSGRRIRAVLPGLRSRRVWGIAGVALYLGVVFAPQIGDKVGHYISKSGRAGSVESIAEAYNKSRGGLIDRMFVNIRENPLTGIGFGIASEPDLMVVERDPLLGLPIGAPVEKGVLPLATLEELGWVGATIVVLWMMALVVRASQNGVVSISVLATALLINMGENVFFSPGGMGLFVLIGVTWAATRVYREQTGEFK